jgi:hypothetical protein
VDTSGLVQSLNHSAQWMPVDQLKACVTVLSEMYASSVLNLSNNFTWTFTFSSGLSNSLSAQRVCIDVFSSLISPV